MTAQACLAVARGRPVPNGAPADPSGTGTSAANHLQGGATGGNRHAPIVPPANPREMGTPAANRLRTRAIRERLSAPLVASLALAAAAGLLTAACRSQPSEEIESTDKVPVVVSAARRGSIRETAGATGVVRPQPGAELVVTAPQPARIVEMPRAIGDEVRKGDLLVRFEIPSLEADAAGRESDLARAEARLETARASLTRVTGLFDRGIAARKEVEEAQREATEAEAGLAEARSATGAAKTLAGRETIRARFDGIVVARGHNPGDLVDPSAADPILRVVDPGRMQVEASVPVAELGLIRTGAEARVRNPSGSDPEEAVVAGLPAAVDTATGSAMVRLLFRSPTHLPSGTPVAVQILGAEHAGVVLVPASAVVSDGGERFVYIVDEKSVAHRRKVAVGVVAGGDAEIQSGVSADERVIAKGQDALPDGAAVLVSP